MSCSLLFEDPGTKSLDLSKQPDTNTEARKVKGTIEGGKWLNIEGEEGNRDSFKFLICDLEFILWNSKVTYNVIPVTTIIFIVKITH